MKIRAKSLWTAASLLASASLLFFLGRLSVDDARAAPTAVAPKVAAPASELARVSLDAARVATPAEPAARWGTTRELLEEYYGLPWREIETLVDMRFVDPDRRARLLPWDEVAASFRREIVRQSPEDDAQCVRDATGWGGLHSAPDWYGDALNPARKALAAIDVQNLERIASEYASRLSDLADAVNRTIPACMADQWDKGRYARSPLCDTKEARAFERDPKAGLTRLVSSSGGGWHVRFRFESSAYPELDALALQIRELKRERVERCRDYIAAL